MSCRWGSVSLNLKRLLFKFITKMWSPNKLSIFFANVSISGSLYPAAGKSSQEGAADVGCTTRTAAQWALAAAEAGHHQGQGEDNREQRVPLRRRQNVHSVSHSVRVVGRKIHELPQHREMWEYSCSVLLVFEKFKGKVSSNHITKYNFLNIEVSLKIISDGLHGISDRFLFWLCLY